MSLPSSFTSAKDYFLETLLFLRDHQHLYNFANTKLLSSNCLDQINIDGLERIDIFNKGVTLREIADLNSQIKDFMIKTERLTVVYDDAEEYVEDIEMLAPLGSKKKHEILYVAREVNKTCEESGCDTVVDFGSGLGYLDQLIYSKHKYNVLGLECSNQNYTSAKTRQKKYHRDSIDKVKYIRYMIDEDSHEAIARFLHEKFRDYRAISITGLHACADLTINALDIFLKMAAARSIVLISCCYHKMALKPSHHGNYFKNFPLSKDLKRIWRTSNGFEYIKVPFLRLAAQPPNVKENLKEIVFNLLARTVLQLYADNSHLKLTRMKRKAVKTKIVGNDFECYIQQATEGFRLTCTSPTCGARNMDEVATAANASKKCKCSLEFNFEALRLLWREHSEGAILKKAAIFVLLQRQLQPLFENLILFDRITYLKENGLHNCRVKKIFNDRISPRCFALVAIKH